MRGLVGTVVEFQNPEEKKVAGDRPSVWLQPNGRWGYRPSGIGGCIRGLVACRLGHRSMAEDAVSIVRMNEGHIHEPHVAANWVRVHKGIWERHRVVQMTTDDGDVIGSVDGVWWPSPASGEYWPKGAKANQDGIDPDVFYLGEIKAQGESAWEDTYDGGPEFGVGDGYDWQRSCYHWALVETMGVVPQGQVWIYKNRNSGITEHFDFPGPKFTRLEIEQRVTTIEALASLGMEYFDQVDCDTFDIFCKWWHLHKKEERGGKEWDSRLEPIAQRMYEATQEIKRLKADKKEMQYALDRALMGRKSVRTGAAYLAYEGNTGERFDQTACFRDNPDLKQQYRTSGTRYVAVKMLPVPEERGGKAKKGMNNKLNQIEE